jgi:hypothetical protein
VFPACGAGLRIACTGRCPAGVSQRLARLLLEIDCRLSTTDCRGASRHGPGHWGGHTLQLAHPAWLSAGSSGEGARRTWILCAAVGTGAVAGDRLDQVLQGTLVARLLAFVQDRGHGLTATKTESERRVVRGSRSAAAGAHTQGRGTGAALALGLVPTRRLAARTNGTRAVP